MRHRIFAGVLLACAARSLAADVVAVKAPAGGPWQGQTPGSFVVFKSNAWDTGEAAVYRRELLLGVDSRGFAVVQYDTSESPDGPWEKPTTQARPIDPKPAKITPLADRVITIDGNAFTCRGTLEEWSAEGNAVTVERWADLNTGRTIQSTRTTKAVGAAFGNGEVIEERLEKVETRTVGDRTVTVGVYLSTTYRDAKPYMSRRTGLSDEVAGRRASYQRWIGQSERTRKVVDETAVAVGFDADTVTFVTGTTPTARPTTGPTSAPAMSEN